MIHEKGEFLTPDCNPVGNLTISSSAKEDVVFGFKFPDGDDFAVAYAFTVISNTTSKNLQKPFFQKMACIYVVAAAGPARPDLRVEEYNGALCHWNIDEGYGEHFFID